MLDNAARDALLMQWDAARQNNTFWKAEEARLRAKIAAELFPEAKVGKNTIELGAGFSAVLEKKQTKSFVIPKDAEFDNLEKAIDTMVEAISGVGNSGAFIAERLVKRKFEVSLSEYNELPVEVQTIADYFIETKDSTPTFELKKPKGSA